MQVSATTTDMKCGLVSDTVDIVSCISGLSKLPTKQLELKAFDMEQKIKALNISINTNKKDLKNIESLESSDVGFATKVQDILNKNNDMSDSKLILEKVTLIKKNLDGLYTCDKSYASIYRETLNSINNILNDVNNSNLANNTIKQTINSCVLTIQGMLESQAEKFEKKLNSSLGVVNQIINSISFVDSGDQAEKTKKVQYLNKVKQSLEVAKLALKENRKLDIGWDHDYVSNFYLGVEGSSVSSVKNKSTERVGFMMYEQSFGLVKFNESGELVDKIAPHLFMNLLSTSSAEATGLDELEQVFEADFNMFWPLGGHRMQNGDLVRGVIVNHGIRKIVDANERYGKKNYFGYRSAFSPEFYFDAMLGKTENLQGYRLQIRGQKPIDRVFSGRLFLGMNINYGVKNSGDVKDSLKLYVTWQTTFTDLFSNGQD